MTKSEVPINLPVWPSEKDPHKELLPKSMLSMSCFTSCVRRSKGQSELIPDRPRTWRDWFPPLHQRRYSKWRPESGLSFWKKKESHTHRCLPRACRSRATAASAAVTVLPYRTAPERSAHSLQLLSNRADAAADMSSSGNAPIFVMMVFLSRN